MLLTQNEARKWGEILLGFANGKRYQIPFVFNSKMKVVEYAEITDFEQNKETPTITMNYSRSLDVINPDTVVEKKVKKGKPKAKVYISGKVTGLDQKEYRNAFNSAELFLTGLGYDVVNPVSYTENPKWKWADYMKRDIKLLMDCDCICMLNGWEGSRGALMEHEIACKLGMKILLLDENGVVV